MKIQQILLIALIGVMAAGCRYLDRSRQQSDVVAEVAGQQLTETELSQITRKAATPEDSARYAEEYIHLWAEELLVYNQAERAAVSTERDAIERLVADYRRSLYVHAYEEKLVKQRMSKTVRDAEVAAYYEANKDQFVLNESLLKGILLIVPNGTPKMDKLKKQLAQPNEENIEHIEKYAYQYATGYELFTNQWMRATQIVLRLPLETDNLVQQLKKTNLIEVQDSVSTYLLQVTDKCLPGEVMPQDYARGEIEEILLGQRQVEFLRQERERLYEEWKVKSEK